jgi:hypothetical protein
MKRIEIAFLFITSLVVIGFTVGIYHSNIDRDSEKFLAKYPMTISNQIPAEYLQLFNKSAQKNLLAMNTFNEKAKFPIANIGYDSTYCIQVYKLSSTYMLSLTNSIIESNANGHRPVKTLYTANQENALIIMDKVGELDTPANIYFSLHGDQKQLVLRNDTVVSYYANCHDFSVKYIKNGVQQICADVDDSHKEPTFLETMFLKRNRNLYFIVMSPKLKNAKLKPGILYGLIKK